MFHVSHLSQRETEQARYLDGVTTRKLPDIGPFHGRRDLLSEAPDKAPAATEQQNACTDPDGDTADGHERREEIRRCGRDRCYSVTRSGRVLPKIRESFCAPFVSPFTPPTPCKRNYPREPFAGIPYSILLRMIATRRPTPRPATSTPPLPEPTQPRLKALNRSQQSRNSATSKKPCTSTTASGFIAGPPAPYERPRKRSGSPAQHRSLPAPRPADSRNQPPRESQRPPLPVPMPLP